MKLNLTDIEFSLLVELVYAGNWVINSCRLPDEIISPYKDMNSNLMKKIAQKQKLNPLHDGNIDDILFARLEHFFHFYTDKTMYDVLATKLGELKYGKEPCLKRTEAEEKYREEFFKNGLEKFIKVLTDIDDTSTSEN